MPAQADFALTDWRDPLGCTKAPGPYSLRLYRRPLPVANTAFATTVQWDGRASLAASVAGALALQANDAARVHLQAELPLSDAIRASIVAFETDLFNARPAIGTLRLGAGDAHGGPLFLRTQVWPRFRVDANDPFRPGFDSDVFTIFKAWGAAPNGDPPSALAESIGRGQVVFNTKPLTITDVPGLNGPEDPSREPVRGFCSTCHNDANVGNHTSAFFVDVGVSSASPVGSLDVARLPVYTFRDLATGRTTTLTDPARGLITGRFSDLGKVKVPSLRGLAARAPYFHNGSAADLAEVVEFYRLRFGIALTDREESDLVAFLSAL
jgi:hypothetical protein